MSRGIHEHTWQALASSQDGIVARRQLLRAGIDAHAVNRRVAGERWQLLSSTVVATTTGQLTLPQRLWFAALHCGGDAIIGGLSAARRHGLRGWERPDVCVLVDDELKFDPTPGVRVVRTRRPLTVFRDPASDLPLCRLEPAVLLYAGYTRSSRTAQGLLAACVQQRLTTPEDLRRWIVRMRPLRRSKVLQTALLEIEGGAESMAELDVTRMCRRFGLPRPHRQVRRRGSDGRLRFTDVEWHLDGGGVLVLEVDGAFHMEADHWEDDLARQRSLTGAGRTVVRASSRELREEPERVAADLIRLGVSGRGSQVSG